MPDRPNVRTDREPPPPPEAPRPASLRAPAGETRVGTRRSDITRRADTAIARDIVRGEMQPGERRLPGAQERHDQAEAARAEAQRRAIANGGDFRAPVGGSGDPVQWVHVNAQGETRVLRPDQITQKKENNQALPPDASHATDTRLLPEANRITFAPGQSAPAQGAIESWLQGLSVADQLRLVDGRHRIEVVGHSSRTGTTAARQRISDGRANHVARALIASGITAEISGGGAGDREARARGHREGLDDSADRSVSIRIVPIDGERSALADNEVGFERGSSRPSDDAVRTVFDRYREDLQNRRVVIEVVGHASRLGSAERNDSLAAERATEVARRLIELGATAQIRGDGMGEAEAQARGHLDGSDNPLDRTVTIIVRRDDADQQAPVDARPSAPRSTDQRAERPRPADSQPQPQPQPQPRPAEHQSTPQDQAEVSRRIEHWRLSVERGEWERAWEDFTWLTDRLGFLSDVLEAVGAANRVATTLSRVMGPVSIAMTGITVAVSIYRSMNADVHTTKLMGYAYGAAYRAAGLPAPGRSDLPGRQGDGFFHSEAQIRAAWAEGVAEGQRMPTAGLGRLSAMLVRYGRVAVLNALWQRALQADPSEFPSTPRSFHLQWYPPGVDRLND